MKIFEVTQSINETMSQTDFRDILVRELRIKNKNKKVKLDRDTFQKAYEIFQKGVADSPLDAYISAKNHMNNMAFEGKKNCGCRQDPCKTYGLQEADRADGAKTAQAMKRAGMDVDNTTFNKTANQNFSGTDAVDQISFKGKQADKRRQDALDQRFDDEKARRKAEKEINDRNTANQDARERSKAERQARKDAAAGKEIERGGKIQGKIDQQRGYRKSADGRTLRHAKYYKDDPDGKGKPQGAIAKGLDRLRADPGYAVSKYYNDKVDQVKDFLSQRV